MPGHEHFKRIVKLILICSQGWELLASGEKCKLSILCNLAPIYLLNIIKSLLSHLLYFTQLRHLAFAKYDLLLFHFCYVRRPCLYVSLKCPLNRLYPSKSNQFCKFPYTSKAFQFIQLLLISYKALFHPILYAFTTLVIMILIIDYSDFDYGGSVFYMKRDLRNV